MIDIYTLALAKSYIDKISNDMKFKVQVESDRSILETSGQEGIFYFLPKENGYDEYLYVNNKWELIGGTDLDLSEYITEQEALQKINENKIQSAIVNQDGTITFTLNDNSTITTIGQSVIGEQGEPGQNYNLTNQDKNDIANLVLESLPNADVMNF